MLSLHIDLKHAMWRRDYMDRLVDRLSAWGFDTILFEFEDKFRFSRHPDLAHPDAWSPEETRSFVDACRARGMDVIPLIQTLGHAEAVVGKPAYAHLREQPDVISQYDPLSEEARALILDLLDEVIDVFKPRQFVHIGGDETRSLGKSDKCQPIVAQIGVGGLYLRHMQPIFRHVIGRGLRPMIWGDIVFQHAEVLDQVPRSVVLVDWDYTRRNDRADRVMVWGKGDSNLNRIQSLPDTPAKRLVERYAVDEQTGRDGTLRPFYRVDALKDLGFDVVTASSVRSAGDSVAMPRVGHLENVFCSTRQGLSKGLGEMVTNWAVRFCHPELTMPATYGARYAAEGNALLDRVQLMEQYTHDTFGVAMPELEDAWQLLNPVPPFGELLSILPAARMLERGEDPLAQYVEALRKQDVQQLYRGQHVRSSMPVMPDEGHCMPDDWVAEAEHLITARREGYLRARDVVDVLQGRAKTNPDVLDYWREAAEVALFHADFALAVLHGALDRERASLLDRIEPLRLRTRELWSRTYTPGSLDKEVGIRFGFHEACLRDGKHPDLETITAVMP
jgi:hypothetical protein